MRLLPLLIALLFTQLLHAQAGKQLNNVLIALEKRDSCHCLTCLPVIEKRLQNTQDKKLIAQGYKEIAAVLRNCTGYDYNNTFTASEAIRYSLMFHPTKETAALLDSVLKEEFDPSHMQTWNKLDSPWQNKILATTQGGGSYIIQEEEGYQKLLCLKTDTGWISIPLPSEGWAGGDSLTYLRDKKGVPQALLITYGITSYGSGGGATWYHAYLLNLHTLSTVYRQSTYYAEEVFCGKYGPDPDCVRDPCTVIHPLYIENNLLIIGPTSVTNKDPGSTCPPESEFTLSFRGIYGDVHPNIQNLKIPAEYTFPNPLAGAYKYKNGYLFRVK